MFNMVTRPGLIHRFLIFNLPLTFALLKANATVFKLSLSGVKKTQMNKFINLIIVCAVILSLSNLSCEKEGNLDKGIITGFDNRMCPCCGGLLINFKGKSWQNKRPQIPQFSSAENN